MWMRCLHVSSKVISSAVGKRAKLAMISDCFMFNIEMPLQILS